MAPNTSPGHALYALLCTPSHQEMGTPVLSDDAAYFTRMNPALKEAWERLAAHLEAERTMRALEELRQDRRRCLCNVDSDGTLIYPNGEGAPGCPCCDGRGEVLVIKGPPGGDQKESYNLRCTDCGHVGNRVFVRRDGVLEDVLSSGVTPDNVRCSCGAPSDRLQPVLTTAPGQEHAPGECAS